MFKYILKQLRRSVVTNVLFCLLLTLAGTLLCLSAGLWYSAHKALLEIDETITTIAIPDRFAINKLAHELAEEELLQGPEVNIYADDEETEYLEFNPVLRIEQEILQTIREQIYLSELLHMDERRFFNAFAEGIEPLTLNTAGTGAEPFYAAHSGQSIAAFLVTCQMITSEYSLFYDWNNDELITYMTTLYKARFSVDEILSLHPGHIEPMYIQIEFILNHDGSSPFERGKQYAVFGNYEVTTGMGMNTLVLQTPDVETAATVTGKIESADELYEILRNAWQYHYFEDDLFPMDIKEIRYAREPTASDGWYSIVEVEGSMEETKTSARWVPMQEALELAKISSDSFQVVTTNDPNSLLRFNQNRNLFLEGRAFTSKEAKEGARVCLISGPFAENNGLSVGDILPLQLYNSVLGAMEVTYMVSDGIMDKGIFWIPSMYQAGLEISLTVEYTIIGIYNTLRFDRSEYAIPSNTVVIPNNSFGELFGEPVSKFDTSAPAPILVNGLIVPNGRIDETREIINNLVPGYGGLFRFYDQGYDSLKTTLANLRFGLTWILTLAAAGWIAVLLIFLMFYVTRKRKDAALLNALGVSQTGRFGWVFIQCTTLILVALGLSIAASLPVYGDILDIAAGAAQEFTDSFRNLTLSIAADSGLRSRIPLDRSPLALFVTVAGASAVTLIAAGVLTYRASAFKSLSQKGGDE